MRDPPTSDTKMRCSGFLIAGTNVRTCLENGEWELETFTMKSEGGSLNYSYCKINDNSLNMQETLIQI